MLGNVLSRLMGLVREQVIAALFGVQFATDVWVITATVPTMVYDLVISGAISAALIPVFSDYADERRREELSRVVSAVLSIATLVLALVVAALMLLAPQLVGLLGGGFDQELQALATYLVRLILPSVLFMGMAGVLTATLYSRQNFTLPAFSVAVYNLGIILGGLLLADRMGVTSLVAGVLLGAVMQVAIQLPGLRGLRLRPVLDLSHPGVRAILRLYAPVAVGLIVANIGVIIDRNLASRTGEGSIAAMRFATTLVQFPIGLVAVATSFAVLPSLSRLAAAELGRREEAKPRSHDDAEGLGVGGQGLEWERVDAGEGSIPSRPDPATVRGDQAWAAGHEAPPYETKEGAQSSSYAATLRMGMKMILVLIIPAAVGLVVLREPVVRLLFERGLFDADATALTALAFLGYSPGMAFAAVDQLLIFAFYARKDTRTPVIVGVFAVFVYLAVALALIEPLGMLGLVLANSAQWIFHALVLLWLLSRVVQGVVNRDLGLFVAKVLGAALLMGLACQLFLVAALPLAATGPGVALLVMGGAGLGAAVYLGAVTLLRVREARELWTLLMRRLRRAG
jgi:peptidoglycan biosynthesis protein MviN/MurJ (putative lipid II flippase)